jgi:hypothetical protein
MADPLQGKIMRNVTLLIVLAAAIMTARVVAQEIVIEPTNGRPQTTNRVTRPATTEAAPAQPKQVKPEPQDRAATKKVARSTAAKKPAAPKTVALETKKPVVEPEPARSEVVEETPAPKKRIPERPDWAMADTRDAHGLQVEIANAIASDPKLSGSSIQVVVDDGTVTLQGRAAGGDEHLQAQRLAKSYAWNRKLVDHIEVVNSVSAQK